MSRPFGWLLNVLYATVLVVAAPMIVWQAWRTGKYREGFGEKFLGRVPVREGDRTCVWFHAVSVGEVNLAGVLIAEMRRRHPDHELVLSTTTKTGFDLAQKKYGEEHTIFYCPLDFSWAVTQAMRRIRPDRLVLAELELWPNLIATAKRQGARVAIVNGRLSENSSRGYRRIGWLARRVLSQVDTIAAQDTTTAERFLALGANPERVVVTGSLKYDGAETNRENSRTQRLRELAGFDEDDTVWLAGSTQAPEEAICLRVFAALHMRHPNLKLVIVPRHPERFEEVAELIKTSGLTWRRRGNLCTARHASPSVLLVDSVGELGAWWGTATLGFVGGSFGDRGGQNMIEPAAYGVATCFGPNTRNFRDIVAALLGADGARVVQDEADLMEFLGEALRRPDRTAGQGDRAKRFVATQLGATSRTVDLLEGSSGENKTQRDAA